MFTIDGTINRGDRGQDTLRTPVCAEVSRRTPILDGDVYCSPACGLRCKKASYDEAVAAANAAARELGEGWTPDVWENLGWYCAVNRGKARVHIDRRRGDFTCYLNTDVKQFINTAGTATEAVRLSIEEARAALRVLERQIQTSGIIPREVAARTDVTDI